MRQLLQMPAPDRHLAGDGDTRAGEALDHVIAQRRVVFDPLVAERRLLEVHRRADGAAVEKDDTDWTRWGAVASPLHPGHLIAGRKLGQAKRGPRTFLD
jgi:hypothetical protein